MTLFIDCPDESPLAAIAEGRTFILDPEPEPALFADDVNDSMDFSDVFAPSYRYVMEG